MKALEIVSALQGKKGQHVAITWQRPCKTRKGFAGIIAKRTEAFVRTGIDFANLSTVKAGIVAGERGEVGSLPWGVWRAGFEKYIIDHKDTEYVRLYPSVFGNLKSKVEYTMDGKPASYEQVLPYLLASEHRKDDDKPVECFTVKAEDIVQIGE